MRLHRPPSGFLSVMAVVRINRLPGRWRGNASACVLRRVPALQSVRLPAWGEPLLCLCTDARTWRQLSVMMEKQLKREHRCRYEHVGNEDDDVHGEADAGEISEAVSARDIYKHVGWRTDRGSET